MLGWTVLSQLKHDPATRHIPVQIVTLDEDRQHGLARGAFSFLIKPTHDRGPRSRARSRSRTTSTPRRKRLLVVEDNAAEQLEHRRAARPRRHRDRRRSAPAPRRWLRCGEQPFDCVRARPAAARHDRLRAAGAHQRRRRACATCRSSCSPARSCRREEDAQLHTHGQQRRRQGRRVARAAARRDRAVPAPRRRRPAGREAAACSSGCTAPTTTCVGQKVLVVDDDARNIFALTQRARAPRHGGADRHQRATRRSSCSKPRPTSRSC